MIVHVVSKKKGFTSGFYTMVIHGISSHWLQKVFLYNDLSWDSYRMVIQSGSTQWLCKVHSTNIDHMSCICTIFFILIVQCKKGR